jgi:hypothetical protein
MSLTMKQKQAILKAVILGGESEPPEDASPEEKAYWQKSYDEVQQILLAGGTPEIPWDSDDPDDETEEIGENRPEPPGTPEQ